MAIRQPAESVVDQAHREGLSSEEQTRASRYFEKRTSFRRFEQPWRDLGESSCAMLRRWASLVRFGPRRKARREPHAGRMRAAYIQLRMRFALGEADEN